jgi:hypothetical protein
MRARPELSRHDRFAHRRPILPQTPCVGRTIKDRNQSPSQGEQTSRSSAPTGSQQTATDNEAHQPFFSYPAAKLTLRAETHLSATQRKLAKRINPTVSELSWYVGRFISPLPGAHALLLFV